MLYMHIKKKEKDTIIITFSLTYHLTRFPDFSSVWQFDTN